MESVLLVEDRVEVRQMLVTALERMGYEAIPAATSSAQLPGRPTRPCTSLRRPTSWASSAAWSRQAS